VRTIWKVEIGAQREMVVDIPKDALFLSVQLQHGVPMMWCEVNTDLPMESRYLYLTGTGTPIPEDENLSYIGTFQTGDGTLVFHLFERLKLRKRKRKTPDDDLKGKKKNGKAGRDT
jgi:hypothetical protein